MKTAFVGRFVPTMILLTVAFGLGARAEAATITVDGVGDAFSVHYAGVSDPGNYAVTVDSNWVTTLYTTTQVQFQVTMKNTTPVATGAAQLTGFGFNSDPDATGGTSTSSLFPFVTLSPNGSFTFDVCVTNANNTCAGGSGNPANSLGIGQTNTFLLTLDFGTIGTGGVVFSDFAARVQGIGPNGNGSAKIDGVPSSDCPDCGVNLTGQQVPEPGTLFLLGSGALVAFRRRFRRQQ
jgi:hypothetical protein